MGVAVITSACGDGSLFGETLALEDTEAVLLINNDHAKLRECHAILDQRMSAHDELILARGDARKRARLVAEFHSAHEQFNGVARCRKNAPRRKVMLHGENFRGRHQRDLIAIFDDDGRCLERHDCLAAAYVAFEQAVHRRRLFEVTGNFGKHAFLRTCGLERKNALESLANRLLSDAHGDAGSLLFVLSPDSEAELVEKEFLEDHSYLGGAAELVQCLDIRIMGRKMNRNQRIAPRRKRIATQHIRGQRIGNVAFELLQRGIDNPTQHA